MAHPISFQTPPVDPREVLRARLERAPDDHAEAILAAYDVLQQLHERGILDVVRAALAASDQLLEMAVETANTPEAIRTVRNLVFWQGVLGRIEPEWLQGIFQAIPDGLAKATAQRDEPVGLWRVLRRAISKNSLRGLAAAVDVLESFGRHLHSLEVSSQKDQPTNLPNAARAHR
jgi:uncharacterized protein YjgD (DUF1641 family)